MSFLRRFTFCASLALLLSCSDSSRSKPPFAYDLQIFSSEGSKKAAIVCFHGLGGDYHVADSVTPFLQEKATVISFNFPDSGKRAGLLDQGKTHFGTIDEVLPALYVLKQTIIDKGFERVCVYGFSAGGAALVNCLSALSNSSYDKELKTIGVGKAEKKKIIEALERGDIILDTPLKSIDELVALYGMTKELEQIGSRYKTNEMDPIESIKRWKDLSLNILVHFQVPDETVSNRDDAFFVERLKEYNQGGVDVLIGHDTGHSLPHASLWEYYLQHSRCL